MTETVSDLTRVPSAFITRDKIPRDRNEYSLQAQSLTHTSVPVNHQKEGRPRKESFREPKNDFAKSDDVTSTIELSNQKTTSNKDLERVPSAFKKRDKIRNTFTPSSLENINLVSNDVAQEPENFHYAFARRDKVRVTFTGSNIKNLLEGEPETQPQQFYAQKELESEITMESIVDSYLDFQQDDNKKVDESLDPRQSIISEEMGEVVMLKRGKSIKSNTIRLDGNGRTRGERGTYSKPNKLSANQVGPLPPIPTVSEETQKELELSPNFNQYASNSTKSKEQNITVKHGTQADANESSGCCTIL